ncbi:hypothetical protein C8Q80DRAFT_1113622 [Daedaleopsis nitida]|nr:hypothetical protein C8Q80DRAFT_1113622 [Daedaleopsis nitida]
MTLTVARHQALPVTTPAGADLQSRVVVPTVTGDPWASCVKALREYDEHMVRGWKEDVDSLLVFAGLFSAVLTAFNIESYKLLQEDPEESTASLLERISMQLAGPIPNIPASSPFIPDARSVRINILWFSSLVLSLVSASIGILTKQWLREYISSTASSSRENARIRQLRQEGFVRWQIPLTIALLPILLQVAMVLFFAGLLDLLWSLHPAVAGVVTVLVTISLSFLVFTTFLPTIRSDCPYKSPQAMGIFLLAQAMIRLMSLVALQLYSWFGWSRREWPLYLDTGLFSRRKRRFAAWLRGLIHRKHFSSWREREKAIVRDSEARLDQHILAGADATLMDDEFLDRVVRPCINDTDCSAAVDCLHEIVVHRADGLMDGVPQWRHCEDVNGGINLLLHLIVDILPRIGHQDDQKVVDTLAIADRLCRAIPFETGHLDTVILYQRLFENLARFLTQGDEVKRFTFDLMRNMWYRSNAPVRPAVIQNLVAFARSEKAANQLHTFHAACEMALAFSTAPSLPQVAFNRIRDELQVILEDLENLLTAPDTDASTVGPGQSASILLALEELAARDPDLISSNMLHILDRVGLDQPHVRAVAAAETDSMASFMQRRLAAARELRRVRESRPRWRKPVAQRRKALDVRGPADLDALNLHLPETPDNAPVALSPLGGDIASPNFPPPSPTTPSHTYPPDGPSSLYPLELTLSPPSIVAEERRNT